MLYFSKGAHCIVCFPHITHNLEQWRRNKRLTPRTITNSKEFFNSADRKGKNKRPGPCVSMVTLALLLFVLCSRCNKSAEREMSWQGVHHMQVLSGWTGCRNRPGNSQSDSNLFYKDLISCHWTVPGMCVDIVYEFSN